MREREREREPLLENALMRLRASLRLRRSRARWCARSAEASVRPDVFV